METRTALKINKENERRGYDSKIATTGTAIKRKKLSDITNTVSSSSPDPQFEENPMGGGWVITKECVTKLMEENAALLKAVTEKNKFIELSGIEFQKLRLTIEKYNQQIRLLAQANTQMQAELTMSKERIKTLQHELGCTTFLLKFKNTELDEKEKLIKELSEKLRFEEEKLIKQLDESRSMEIEQLKHMEVTNGDIACLSSRKPPCRSKTVGSTTSIIQSKQKRCKERHDNINDEVFINEKDRLMESDEMKTAEDDGYKCGQVAYSALRSNPVDDAMSYKLSKRALRGRSLGETATAIKQGEAKETCAKRKYSKRRSDNLTSEAWKFVDFSHDPEFPADSVTSDPLNETESKGENNTRKSSKKRSKRTKYETQESEENFIETMDGKIQTCAPIIESFIDNPSVTTGSTGEVQNTQKAASSSSFQEQMAKRMSVGRPMRKAAEKISSYKEIPLNVKMRRS